MRAIALCYHDVDNANGAYPPLRHPSPLYCLSLERFRGHMDAIQAQCGEHAVQVFSGTTKWAGAVPVLLTFDDGARGAIDRVAPELEARGWRGFFFVTTDWIGLDGYLTAAEIRELQRRGHVVGSHSCSHPERMAALTAEQLRREWVDSCAKLADVTGQAVKTASVPGGFSSRRVASCAAEAGIEVLFTSDPRSKISTLDDCLILGRYAMQRPTSPATAGQLAAGRPGPRLRQAAAWELKRAAKTVAGPYYLSLRKALLSLRPTRVQDAKP
ncbi:MAG TPA: polysaccharide deacetylase family protein [Bryobacteraceae bacterium]|nr:polysaccharide deacetylase family protein [Bryobacteraceae bacterium]HPT28542.1 polysaccharide deacetylase family protein [Bryobacteraceae bacterium]